ncbi:MAG: hypothetical protein P1V20_02430 [Verrucomicrobiales bacterium]|nr:hypothetical protein [Verrucomicrobiales bacterium]
MRSFLFQIVAVILLCVLPGCAPKEKVPQPDVPLSGGIQLSLHTTGGTTSLNECILISDHWQLTSVGRRHGWVRKLEPDEQRQLVRAMQGFESLVWTQNDDPEIPGDTSMTLTARGSGEGVASKKDAEALGELVQKFVSARRIASR